MNTNANDASTVHDVKLFEGEKWLVGVSIIGFLLAAVCAVYIVTNGAVIPPEGNVESAFSFNAAIAMFVLCIAAFMPLSGLTPRKRVRLRWGFILTVLIGYGIETIQHFRGINPRFTKVGTLTDIIIGGFFGLISLVLVGVTVLLAVSFFSRRQPNIRPLLNLGVRYAFVSTMIAFLAGIVMIVLQSRYTGADGNFIVLHGIGFHALQALPLLGWLLERVSSEPNRARSLIHIGSVAWLVSNVCIGIQTIRGETVFELTLLPIVAAIALLVWLVIAVICSSEFLKHLLVNRARSIPHS